jgi:hypothetical protein
VLGRKARAGWLKRKKKEMGCCCSCWAGLDGGKGKGEKVWGFRDLGKGTKQNGNSNFEFELQATKTMLQHVCHK